MNEGKDKVLLGTRSSENKGALVRGASHSAKSGPQSHNHTLQLLAIVFITFRCIIKEAVPGER